jgi:putative ABC transport system substrate-binding protein
VLALAATADLSGPQPRSASTSALLAGLRDLGYVYGEHFVTEARGAQAQPQRFPSLVAELLRSRVDVIVAAGPALPTLKQATDTVPVVMAASSDPIAQGLVQSLGRPGGNFTGHSLQSVEITGKRLELLKELVPGAAPVAVLWHSYNQAVWEAAQTVARQQRWSLISLQIHDVEEIDGALRKATVGKAGALLVFAAGALFPHARRVADLAARHRLPAMYELRHYVEVGGLMCYGPDIDDIWRRSAVFVDKILKGSRPGDLPIEQPSEFELVINLKTARALGLTVPQAMLLRAEEVIQ